MTTFIILGLPCLVLALYIYTLKQLNKQQIGVKLNKIQNFCLKYLLPIFALIGVIGILCGFIGLFQLTFGLTLTTIALRF